MQKRLVGDEEVASLLSGGIDSSLVSAIYAKVSGKKINTFSIGYDEYLHYDELNEAKEASQHIGSIHHELRIGRKDYINIMETVLTHFDEPMGDSASFPTYLISKMIHEKGIKTSLSGEGSDEIFLGYDNYFHMAQFYSMNNELSSNSKSLLKNYLDNNQNLSRSWEYLNRVCNNEQIFYSGGETFTKMQLDKLQTESCFDVREKHPYENDPYLWMSKVDLKIWIAEVLMSKIDRMSMANSLELRAPFLDYRLVDYMLSLPGHLRAGDTNKYLLKKIASKYIPTSIVNRRKKGFSSPFIEWLYAEYDKEILTLMLKVANESGLFHSEFIKYLYLEGKEGRFKQHIWSLYLFCRWYQKVFM